VNVPLNPEFKEDELKFYFADANVKFVIVDEERAELTARAAAAPGADIRLIVHGEPRPGMLRFADLLTQRSPRARPPARLDDDLLFIYSSGSTGRPKCVPRTVLEYWWETQNVIAGLSIDRADVIFCAIPLFHNFGAVHCMMAAAASGAKLVMLEHPHPFLLRRARALKLLQEHAVTILPAVPLIFEHLAASSRTADLGAIRMCYSAAAALTRDTAEAFYAKYAIAIRQHYGCTEAGALTLNTDEHPQAHTQWVGRALPGVRITILDDAGQCLPPGVVGDVAVKSRAMTRGYLGMAALNREMFKNGYFCTGDLGKLDETGRLFLLGRKKLVIDVAGQKVSPIEVEDTLAQHPLVADSVVVGLAQPGATDQRVIAYVAVRAPCEAQALMAFCRERLANFKVPQEIAFITAVPRDALGKVMRRKELLEQLLVPAAETV
jgi:long-chain acyl-CoA synthetase